VGVAQERGPFRPVCFKPSQQRSFLNTCCWTSTDAYIWQLNYRSFCVACLCSRCQL